MAAVPEFTHFNLNEKPGASAAFEAPKVKADAQ